MEEGGGTGLTAHQIYIAMTTGPGSETLDEAQQSSAEEAQRQVDRADRIRKLAEKIQAGWQGSAAEGAYGAAGPLADAARDRADHLTVADNLLATQSGVFNSASHSVRPVPEKPPESNILTDMVPWETDLDRQIKQYQADVQHNMAVYGMYDGESLSNQERLPREYPTITDPGGTVSVASSGGGPGGPPDGGPGYPLPRPGGGGDVSGYSGGSGGGGGGPVTPPGAGGGQATSQGTGASEFVPPPVNPPGYPPPAGGLPPGGSPPGPGPVAPPVPVGGGYPGGQVGRGPGAEGGRSGSGPGRPGARGGGGEGGSGGRGSGGGPVGRGPGGPGVGGPTAEEAAARRGGVAGARGGAAGTGAMGALGAGRGQGGEDKEHERKSFLREPDPEAIFGTDEVTAPPVIGEDE